MDIHKLRSETPGCRNVIHFNNAGASLMPRPVVEATISYLREEAEWGGYETAQKYRNELEESYPVIADFINAEAEEIAILENATAAWHMAFHGLDFEAGDRILTSEAEYASNYISYLKLRKNKGVSVEVIPSRESGETSVRALEKMMDEKVKLISITHIPTNGGLVNPVEEIGRIAADHPCLYLVDACQSVGHYPMDVQEIGCDMLSATGRKYLRGPRGTGFLYVRNETLPRLEPPFLDLYSAEWTGRDQYRMREDARRFENWESNYAGIMGLKTAVRYAGEIGINNIWNRIVEVAGELRRRLSSLPFARVHDIGSVRGGIVTFTVEGLSASSIKSKLSKRDINVSVSTKSSTLIDMEERGLEELVRASVHYYNTSEEIDTFIGALQDIS